MSEIVPHNLEIQGYTDNRAVKTSYTSGVQPEEVITCNILEETMLNIKDWMNINRLKMNGSKTEFIVFSLQQPLMKSTITRLNVNHTQVEM